MDIDFATSLVKLKAEKLGLERLIISPMRGQNAILIMANISWKDSTGMARRACSCLNLTDKNESIQQLESRAVDAFKKLYRHVSEEMLAAADRME